MCDTIDISNETTKQAIKEWQEGKTIKCKDFEEYLMKVKIMTYSIEFTHQYLKDLKLARKRGLDESKCYNS